MDYKLLHADIGTAYLDGLEAAISHVHDVARDFFWNSHRVADAAALLPLLVDAGMRNVKAEVIATHRLTGNYMLPLDISRDEGKMEILKMAREKLVDESYIAVGSNESAADKAWNRVCSSLSYILSKSDSSIQRAAKAWCESPVILAWTAIEVMIADLAKASIKLRAMQKPFKGEPWRILEMVEAAREINAETRPPDRPNQVSFSSLENARISYARIFAADSASIDECMASLDLDALYLVRNQLVHEGGRLNEKFIQFSKGIPALEAWRKVDALTLDGTATKTLVENALIVAVRLIKSVDTWLGNHP